MEATRWALLCGGNFYFDGAARDHRDKTLRFPDLEGCVQDVHAMRDFLVRTGVTNITMLTATRGEGRPAEDEKAWPTRQNILRELDRITDTAAPGDLVYIHYSGHGIRRDAAPPDPDGDGLMGSAFVMTDVLRGKPYLTAYHLGVLLQKMVEKSLRVTLVLDCCYSGRGIRDSEITPRTVPDQYDDSLLPSDINADSDIDSINASLGQRDAGSVQKNWLSNPSGCTVLAACGPQEVAGEGRFGDSNSKHGAFTYSILKLLRGWRGGALPSHAGVLDHVKSRFRELKLKQSPTVLGDGCYEFFGTATYVPRPTCHVTAFRGGRIGLDVGAVQGVVVGALYNVFLKDQGPTWRHDVLQLQARATQVSLFESTATLLSGNLNADDGREWCAVLCQWGLPRQYLVEFITSEMDLRAELKEKLERCPGLSLSGTSKVDFTVQVDREQTYEIVQNGARLPRLPRISVRDKSGIDKLAYILSHVARFQALRQLCDIPRSRHLQAADFTFSISGTPSTTHAADDDISTKEGETLDVSLAYGGPGVIHVSLYCFTASWGIQKLDPTHEEGRVSNPVGFGIPPSQLEITMEVPTKSRPDDPSDITDIFTMFASSADHVSWDEICLSSLPVNGSLDNFLVDANIVWLGHRDPRAAKRKNSEPRWAILERAVHTSPKDPPPP